ncbi:flavin reductase family protein [Specibacter sp. NPDC078692]|uniref:flavin reductase family protein n=1 Tax=Specibacter sp. NPDC078692 TaxID=3155818 RepID=UPI003448B3E8
MLVGNAATFGCRAWNNYNGGDHVIVVGAVCALTVGDAGPLLFHEGAFLQMGECLDEGQDGASFAGAKSFEPFIR